MNIIEYAKQNFSFYNEKDYYELKKKLLNCIINFKHMNLFEEQEIDKNYDLIYFSNILLFSGNSLEFFRDGLLSKYLDCLNKSGILVLNYAHHFAGIDKEKIRLNDLIANHLNEDIINCFASFIDITKKVKSSGFGKGIYEDDLVIALKKHD
jgi:chemotaxis methyl-accepting protein methylase